MMDIQTFWNRQNKKFMKVRSILEDIFYNGKMHGLSISDAYALTDVYNEMLKPGHTAETFIGNVASIFKKAGFSVLEPADNDGVNFLIAL